MLRHAVPIHWLRSGALALAAAPFFVGASRAATPAMNAPQPTLIKLTPGMAAQAIAGRADSDLVELPNGRQMTVGAARRLQARVDALTRRRTSRFAGVLRMRPAASGARIADTGLTAALKRPDGETLQLPSGQRLTVAQLKLIQPLIERRLGQPLASLRQRPASSGVVVKVGPQTPQAQWVTLMKNSPDTTVLEGPTGELTTVGELKQELTRRADLVRSLSKQRGGTRAPAAKGGTR